MTNPLVKTLVSLGLLATEPPASQFTEEEGVIRSLSRLNLVNEVKAIKAVANRLCIPYVDLEHISTLTRLKTDEYLKKTKGSVFHRYRAVPLYEENGQLLIAFSNPLDSEGIRALEFALDTRFALAIAEERKILHLLQLHNPAPTREVNEDGTSQEDNSYVEIIPPDKDDVITVHSTEAPQIIKICNKILADAVKWQASDIHMEPTHNSLDIRLRIDGVMHNILELPKAIQPNITSRFKVLAGLDIAERRRPQDGRIRARLTGQVVDIRVSSIPITYGEKLVLRLLSSTTSPTFDSVKMPPAVESKMKRHLGYRGKLLLVTGPTGSGKTTSLYACLNAVKDGKTNIQTVEDPVEYRFEGINQIQVNDAIDVTFASALRSVLRQDPDVIMIGEIRDAETAQIALQAAQTGHLVLSTLHTNSAPAAITRLVNLGVDPFVISSALAAVLAQRLVRKVCTDCSEPVCDEYVNRHLELIRLFKLDRTTLREGKGCESCNHIGYKGRVSIMSLFEISTAIAEMIHEKRPVSELIEAAKQNGFVELGTCAVDQVKAGITTFDEVKAHIETVDLQPASSAASSKKVSDTMKKRDNDVDIAQGAPSEKQNAPQQPQQAQLQQAQLQYPPGTYPPGFTPPGYIPYPQQAQAYVPGYPPQPAYPPGYAPHPMYAPQYPPQQMVPVYQPQPVYAPQYPPQFPVAQPLPVAQPVVQQSAEVEEEGPIRKTKLVLIEDSPELRLLFTAQLESDMYQVISAVDGADGLNKVYEHTPDVILCDLMMPNLDGKEFLRRVKGNELTRKIPVVMLTASDQEDNELELLSLGAADFISKLSSTQIMLTRVRKACKGGSAK